MISDLISAGVNLFNDVTSSGSSSNNSNSANNVANSLMSIPRGNLMATDSMFRFKNDGNVTTADVTQPFSSNPAQQYQTVNSPQAQDPWALTRSYANALANQ